jgi:glycosyltransferase involved in cell wall biosynthesis
VVEPLVTVVVLNWNGAHLLPDCLVGLAGQDLPEGQVAVWVVDNASTDGSLELLAREFPWVRAIANPSNDGFAGGNNVALREVDTPFVALINNDARPEPDWLRRLLEPFGKPGAERLGAVSAKLVFLPRFLAVELATPAFVPGTLDTRELGVRVYQVAVDGTDVTERVLWDRVAYGPEGDGPARFRWTRPAGMLLVPVDRRHGDIPVRLGLRVAAETTKPVELTWSG